jgi:sugar (pentulose or hexulose) kinase
MRYIAVIDIGKTNAKLALFDLVEGKESDVRRAPNRVIDAAPYPHHDIDGLWRFIKDALADLARNHQIDAISISAHGASIILLDEKGDLALPMLDYEHHGVDETAADYDAIRPGFNETGSPRLAAGLNVGAQLYWQQRRYPENFARVATIIPYPQYWAFRLTGKRVSEMTSLGAHTDLWNPHARDYSSLVDKMGWRRMTPPMSNPFEPVGGLAPEIAAELGLAEGLPVFGGLHDSNASLLTHLKARTAPFSVVSTGTWVICFAIGGHEVTLDPTRDTLMNVNAYGDPVPSSRFMGGRAFAALGADPQAKVTDDDKRAVLDGGVMFLPSEPMDTGPFIGRKGGWTHSVEALTPGARLYAASLYLGLMTGVCLELIGADGPSIVEGPFAANADYLDMLGAVTARPVETGGAGATGTSAGAAALALGRTGRMTAAGNTAPSPDPRLGQYARQWRETVDKAQG